MNMRARIRNVLLVLVTVASVLVLVFNILYITFWRLP